MLRHFIHRWFRIPYTLHVHTNQRVKHPRAVVLFLHGIGSSGAAWDEVVKELPNDLHVISIDLLGFGRSPQPSWISYSAKTQARSVLATLLRLRIRGPVVLVGHSLGALVAVEVAKRYPLFVRSLVLFSPPFYRIDSQKRRLTPNFDKMRRELYQLAKNQPDQFLRIVTLGIRLGLLNKTFHLTEDNASVYFNAFEASILNQTSLEDAAKLHVATHIVYGRFDPVVISSNLRYLQKRNPNITVTAVLASHEIIGAFVTSAAQAINGAINKK